MAGNEEPVIHFLAGVLAGFVVGGFAAFKAFNAVTVKMANLILEGGGDPKCRP